MPKERKPRHRSPQRQRESTPLTVEQVVEILQCGGIDEQGLLPWSSNYTFLVTVQQDEIALPAVYKPRRGERPLWDFTQGTLCQRERAAYVVSEALGWLIVPPTVLRDGPHGYGSIQLYIDCDQEEHYLTFRDDHEDAGRHIALFDVLINNADRKSGHVLLGYDGHVWAIDHGITFHADPKLRTVIWDFAGEPIAADLMADLRRLQDQLRPGEPPRLALAGLLDPSELRALDRRLERLLQAGAFPNPGAGRHIPWPMV
ncbi:MAG: SCO1664 family protein [Anaerolineae bacterium]|nr:SCO1664 family protein [Anaerolineae bacterium]